MRLHVLSDLHLEFAPFTPPAVAADAVILAGDIGTGRNGLKWALKSFPERPVIYVFALNGDPVMSEVVAQTTMSDYRRVRTLPRYSRLKPSDTRGCVILWLAPLARKEKSEYCKRIEITRHEKERQQGVVPKTT